MIPRSDLFRLSLRIPLLALVLAVRAPAQPLDQDSVLFRPAVERSFQDALRLFTDRRFAEAEARFQGIISETETSHRTSAAYLMAAKSLYHQGEYQSSASLLGEFLDRFKNSRYADDALYTLGLDFYQLERYDGAARAFLKVSQNTVDTVLSARSGKMLELVASANLSAPALRSLLEEARRTEIVGFLSIVLSEKILRTGDIEGARGVLRPILTLPRGNPIRRDAQKMLDKIDKSGVVKVGVVLPMMLRSDQEDAQGVGESLLSGIQLATDEHNAEAVPKVSLEVRNSEQDAGVAAREVSLLSSDDQILAIVGPVFSNEVFASAGLAAARGIPLITPTATSAGIAALGECIFQANPDVVVRGRAMAQYAALALGARRFAVLSASDTSNRVITLAFTKEVEKLGGQVVDVEMYSPGQTDLRDELTQMRRRGLELMEPVVVNFGAKLRPAELRRMEVWGVPIHVLDSVTISGALVPVEFLFGDSGARIADSLNIPTQRIKARYDSLEIPVTSIDAMFVPIANSDEIGIVSSQLRYFNFQTQLLGNGSWNDLTELEQHRRYSSGVIFSTDTYWEEMGKQFQQFSRGYRAKFERDPDVSSMIGYDAMKLLLRAVRQGATHRQEVVAALSTGRPFQGIHSKINLGPGRVNSFLTLLQFKARVINKVGEIDVERPFIREGP
jgi:ABC-type branched-subunit amino acid transport system substrate-binding protein